MHTWRALDGGSLDQLAAAAAVAKSGRDCVAAAVC